MNNSISPATQELQLKSIPFRLYQHLKSPESLEQAAHERNQTPEQVVRSILFRVPANQSYLLCLMPGPAQISWPALRHYLGVSNITMATREEVFTVTGYQLGAVNPFGLPSPQRVIADNKILGLDEISLGSGVRGTALIMSVSNLRLALPQLEFTELFAPS